MRFAITYYRLFNILSLDVATGAVISALFFAEIYGASPSSISLLSLGLTVWIIYTADRLLDVWDARGEISSERHQFHKKHQQILVRCLLIAAVMDCALIFFMPVIIIKRGVFLTMVVIGYVLLRKKLYIFKEFFVAVLYTAGVLLPIVLPAKISHYEYLPILQFLLIALLNLIIFSWYEREMDVHDEQDSIATKLDERVIRYIILGLFFLSFALSFYTLLFTSAYSVCFILMMMTAIHILIFVKRTTFEHGYLYRLTGDAAFLVPLIYIL
jgi:hypothetical protein